jgi:hypothetical protein
MAVRKQKQTEEEAGDKICPSLGIEGGSGRGWSGW